MKTHTTLTIEGDVIEKAKKVGLNLSAVAERAIKEAMTLKKVEINTEINKCEYCGREMRKATKEDLNGLTWIYPDERWICLRCLNIISIKAVGQ
jgi:uncharacterized protein with PIN domain